MGNSKIDKLNKLEKVILYVFLLLTLSGALRKWVIDNAIINIVLTALPLLSIFIILFFVYKSLPKERQLYSSKYGKLLSIFMFFLIPMAANPLNHTFIHGIVGILLHSSFWLFLFAYLSNRDIISLKKLIPYFILISILQVMIGIVQYNSHSDAVINQYIQSGVENIYEEDIMEEEVIYAAKVNEATRASGTFSYIGGYASYMLFLVYLFMTCYNQLKKEYLLIGLFLLSFLGTLTTGSRSSIIIYIIIVVSFFTFQIKEKSLLIKLLSIFIVATIVNIGLGDFTGLQNQFSTSINNITERIVTNQEEGNKRVEGPINALINPTTPYPLVGVGLGTSYQGINALLGSSKYNTGVEHEIGRTILDGGFILLFLKAILFLFLVKNLNGNKLFYLFTLPIVFLTTLITTNPYTNFYLALGIMLLDNALYVDKQTYAKELQ